MTPEERAKELIDNLPWDMDYEAWQQLRTDIAAAIRAAVEYEREVDAHICDVMGQDIDDQWFGNEDFRRGANRCAYLIRNQLTVALQDRETENTTKRASGQK